MYDAIFKYCDIGGIFQDFGQMIFGFGKNLWTWLYELLRIIFVFVFLFVFMRNCVVILGKNFKHTFIVTLAVY